MNETSKTKRGWRILRRILITLAVLATLIAAFYAEEDWRGRHGWESYKHEWDAKGEKFDLLALVPQAVPDDQNFFTAPIFTNMLSGKIIMLPYGDDGGPDYPMDTNRSGYAVYRMRMTDLSAWQNYYRHQTNVTLANRFPVMPQMQTPAADVLYALSKFDSPIEQLRKASERPYANVPIQYENGVNASAAILLPYLATLKRCTQLLQLRVSAELAAGQTTNALADVKLSLYLNDSLRSSPFLISCLVRIAIVSIDLQPIWEGLAEHKWSDEQLAELDAELRKMDFLTDSQTVMRSEEATSIATIDGWRQHRKEIATQSFERDAEGNRDHGVWDRIKNMANAACLSWMPDGWYYQNELAVARMHQAWDSKIVDAKKGIVSPEAIQEASLSDFHHKSLLWNLYAGKMLPLLGAFARKVAIIQVEVDLARTACALERYRLAHGTYPETLDAIVPQYAQAIPRDIINGQPLHYRRTQDGNFVLYSVGWNETDDGGLPGTYVDAKTGDWVWQYPAK